MCHIPITSTPVVLPHANLEIEKVFSDMNFMKSNERNILRIKIQRELLNIGYRHKRNVKRCYDYNQPSENC